MNLHINSTDGVKIKRSNLIIILVHHSCLFVYISASSIFSQKPCHKHLSSHATQSLKVGTNLSCVATMLMCIWVLAFICGHLHERVEGHRKKTSSICKHYTHEHNGIIPEQLIEQFSILAKCSSKFDYLVKQMVLIKNFTPSLNVQSNSLRAKVFTQWKLVFHISCICSIVIIYYSYLTW